jgi:AhpD family alkylhydroperoxidase
MPIVGYIDEEETPQVVNKIFEATSKSSGKVPNNLRVIAYNVEVLKLFGPFTTAILHENFLASRIKELAILKIALINGCKYCLAHHYHFGLFAGATIDEMLALNDFEASPLFSERDRAAIAFAEEFTRNSRCMKGEVKERVKAFMSKAEVVDLALACGMYDFLTKFNPVMEIDLDTDVPEKLLKLMESTPGPCRA